MSLINGLIENVKKNMTIIDRKVANYEVLCNKIIKEQGCNNEKKELCVSNFDMNIIDIKCVAQNGAIIPEYKTTGAAGADICALLSESITVRPMERVLVPTGLFFEIPEGYEIQVRPRSGLAIKNGITCLNTPGTIDSDYRGEVKVILINLGNENFTINNGDRIAQIVVSPVTLGNFVKTDSLESTERGEGGFGSTGR